MKIPTMHEVASHVAEHYGITKGQAFEIMRTPTHPPAGLRDEFAIHAPKSISDMTLEENASWRYKYADAMLKERTKC